MSAYVVVENKDVILDSLDMKDTSDEFTLYANAAKDKLAKVLDAAGISCQFYDAEDTGEVVGTDNVRGLRWFPAEKSRTRKRNFITNHNEVLVNDRNEVIENG